MHADAMDGANGAACVTGLSDKKPQAGVGALHVIHAIRGQVPTTRPMPAPSAFEKERTRLSPHHVVVLAKKAALQGYPHG